jgi:Tfp pilus assembly protein PilX
MHSALKLINNDRGSVIVVALLLLVFLTIIGITATSNSVIESNITRNSQIYKRDFYAADSGWRHSAMWLQDQELNKPGYKDANGVVKFAGNNDVANDNLDPAFPAGTEDSDANSVTPYWFSIMHLEDRILPGNSGKCADSRYLTTSYGGEDGAQTIEAGLSKPSCNSGGANTYN